MEAIFSLLILGGILWLLMKLLRWMLNLARALWQLGDTKPGSTPGATHSQRYLDDDQDGMNPGDYYNGPGGYDATGGYQEGPHGRDG